MQCKKKCLSTTYVRERASSPSGLLFFFGICLVILSIYACVMVRRGLRKKCVLRYHLLIFHFIHEGVSYLIFDSLTRGFMVSALRRYPARSANEHGNLLWS